MRIGQLARTAGVSADTLRYYERIGLLPAPRRTDGGYRDYPPAAADRIRVIRNAVQLGFPLAEIASVLRVRDAGGAPCRQVRDYAQHLIGEIDQRVAELAAERKAMLGMVRGWDRKLEQANGGRAHLLDGPGLVVRSSRPKQARLLKKR